MINITAFECEITDPSVDVFIGPSRNDYSLREGDEPFLFVVLPSFSFKVRLSSGNLAVLRSGLDRWSDQINS